MAKTKVPSSDHVDPLPRFSGDVVLRRLTPSDLASFQAYRRDPMVAQYQDWSGGSELDAIAFLAEMKVARLLQPGIWSQIGIAERNGGGLIGDIGLATAAVQDAIGLVFEITNADRVVGIADARNLPSIRLLQRVGMHLVDSREALFRGQRCLEHSYAILRAA